MSKKYDLPALVKNLVDQEHTVIIFRNSQFKAETTYRDLQPYLGMEVALHRGGLDKRTRVKVEQQLKEGKIKVVVCTSTLELGIDIGKISCVITPLVSINSLYQRIGRAGRSGKPALAILEIPNSIMGEYYTRSPKHYFTDVTPVSIETENTRLIAEHIILSAFERPIKQNEYVGYERIIEQLVKQGSLVTKENGIHAAKKRTFSFRGASKTLAVFNHGQKIATRSYPYAIWEYCPHSIRYISGKRYQVTKFIPDKKLPRAIVEEFDGYAPYQTAIKTESYHYKDEPFRYDAGNLKIEYGFGNIQYEITGIMNKKSKYNVDKQFFTPITHAHWTNILVITLPEIVHPEVHHTLKHLILSAMQMVMGTGIDVQFMDSAKDEVVIYDTAEHGNGVTNILFKKIKKLFYRIFDVVDSCDCKSKRGCPKCTFDIKCRETKIGLNKYDTKELLKEITESFKR